MNANRCGPTSFRATYLLLSLLVLAVPLAAQAPPLAPAQLARIDSVFARWNLPSSAGCALGVSYRDQVVLERAWGMAELEHGVPITPATIFEAGSVTKQFTTAAILLLAQEGKLSLDDDIRKHVPEVPDYGAPITIRHLIHHISGLKDWGAIADIGGWPRGSRIYTHAHVLEIVSRQRTLNHPPGDEYIYSNTNYNLLAIIAERVSGESLPALTKRLIFDPLGMTRTGWRDDFQRLVPGRAQAYTGAGTNWRLQMPNENVYGNSSLLTTVGDLLIWSANATHLRVGGEAFLREQLRQGRLTSGEEISYAGGVSVTRDEAGTLVSHTGATAGYRAYLGRLPDSGWAVAILCNAANAPPAPLGRGVVDALLKRAPRPAVAAAPSATLQLSPGPTSPLEDYTGRYVSGDADVAYLAEVEAGYLVLWGQGARRIVLVSAGGDRFTSGGGELVFTRNPAGQVDGIHWSVERARNVRFVRERQ
ncbi:MAG: serine hydrolase domain-containing protein [Gemmatimonadales bacterium]